MAYYVPSLLINQEFTQIPTFTQSPLSALIIGPIFTINGVNTITVGAGGTGYTSAPTVVITDTTGHGATATASVTSGAVTTITVNNKGFNYTNPTITFVGAGTGATATAALSTTRSSTVFTENSITTAIGAVNSHADILTQLGDIAPGNPLAYACYMALLNSNNTTVYYGAVGTNDLSGYTTVLSNLATKSNNYYGIVPLSTDSTITAAVIGHVNAMSAASAAKWRTCWLTASLSGSGSIQSQVDALAASITTVNSAQTVISSANGNTGPRRIHYVFPDTFYVDPTTSVAGYFLSAALAGLRSGSVPHQSLTNTQVIGPYYLDKCVTTLTSTQLDTLAAAGTWIVTQNAKGGVAYTRQQLTADNSGNLNFAEDSVVANVDSISYGLQAALAPFVGVYNITPASVLKIKAAVDAELNYRLTSTYTERAGNQLNGYTIVKVVQNATILDQVDVVVQLQVPYPANFITITLSI
jgi:hypothetical protein